MGLKAGDPTMRKITRIRPVEMKNTQVVTVNKNVKSKT